MVNFLTFLSRFAQIRQCNGFACTDIFHAIVFVFQIIIAIGILAVALFESCHMSLEDFLHRLFDVFSHHIVEFYRDWKPIWPSILGISLHAQDRFSYEFDTFFVDQIDDFVVTDLYAVPPCGGNRAK